MSPSHNSVLNVVLAHGDMSPAVTGYLASMACCHVCSGSSGLLPVFVLHWTQDKEDLPSFPSQRATSPAESPGGGAG